MSTIYFCGLCEQKYMEHKKETYRNIYTERVADDDKREVTHKNCRICSKLFGDRYGTVTVNIG
tara:strand:- start:556 stop:744 length:189 start_codon:yes stop_codon:yes gene_type:complete